MTSYPQISDDPGVQAAYESMRDAGESHNISEMLATKRLPGSLTDREFFRGAGTLADQFRGEEEMLTTLAANARREGVSLNYTDVYCPPIAEYPLDPKACVPAGGGRGYVKDLCRKRGLGCEGLVKVKPSGPSTAEINPPPTPRKRRRL